MKKLFVVCILAGMMSSCGSVLTLNEAYSPAAEAQLVQPTATDAGDNSGAALLGSWLSSLADDGAKANTDGTAFTDGGIVSGLLGSILNTFTAVDEKTIVGTWHFKGSAFVFESENALASLGSDVVASQIEAKVDQYLAKYNIKEGACSVVFNADGTFVFTLGDRYIEGNYELNADTKELKMTFGMFASTANVVYDASMINLVYQSDGLLRILKAVGSKSSNNTFALLNTLLEQYDGLRIGMAFAK